MQGAFAGQKTARERKTKGGRQKSTNFVGFFSYVQKFAMDMDERDTKRQTHSCYMDEHTRYKVLNDKYTI